ncbi:glycosyltransferase family 90 protein [Piedraia hortae CBS 480.64]|uniref:Glycosyltransferase family 90 protein n=1 Tax=Piedraia hortae CBS 480.64 TaxID=1314780 RepID=A0A6A7BU23_9PEZI|nr:glycosyltransferase family 90 protein [Piedraia hortae CBS 480.64]
MTRTKWLAIAGVVVGTHFTTRQIPTSFAFDKPLPTAIILLATCAIALLIVARFTGRKPSADYEAIPLEDLGETRTKVTKTLSRWHCRPRISSLVLIASISLRAAALQQILGNIQCSRRSWEPLIPLVWALWDYWTVQRHQPNWTSDDPEIGAYEELKESAVRARYRYVLAISLISFGSFVALATTGPPPSTQICPSILPFVWLVPLLQFGGTLLDLVILACLVRQLQPHRGSLPAGLRSIGYACLVSSAILSIGLSAHYVWDETGREWILSFPAMYSESVAKLASLVCFTFVCALVMIYHTGYLATPATALFVAVMTSTTIYSWNTPYLSAPTSLGLSFFAAFVLMIGLASFFHIESATDGKTATFQSVPSLLYITLVLLLGVRLAMWISRSSSVSYHPIDYLIYDAQHRHEAFRRQAMNSSNLEEAVSAYRIRYGRHPPPGFDHWYKYATERNTFIMDDFDSIYRDLTPFWSLSPEVIRERTWELISNPWNDASGISIRNGHADITSDLAPPTHRWMLEGVCTMINQFSQHLPDMDLAFNLNDEPRVTVPYGKLPPTPRNHQLISSPRNSFSKITWRAASTEEPYPNSPLTESSSHPTFYQHGSISCPPTSPARTQRMWDTSVICTSCTFPHSLGAFLSNWTLAGEICHQPDLANLHGLYLSPAAYKGTHELYPIFSQGKPTGFSDILYPSAWNWLEKAIYSPTDENPDPPFREKSNTLFWRGATSEGISTGRRQWVGMTRQRFVSLANNARRPSNLLRTSEAGDTNAADADDPAGKLRYIPSLPSINHTDIHLVTGIARCGGDDCPSQFNHFKPFSPPIDFQAHWQYKFLLDLDGAGFSGRFLPFMRSRSLPFKAALLREWWDDRLTPWWHFVPLDVRGSGFWATIEYFLGREGRAGDLAMHGRRWAERTLRREDMEVYLYRLLLEWGRVVDDEREGIGFGG